MNPLKTYRSWWGSIFLSPRLFPVILGLALLYVLSYFFSWLYPIAWVSSFLLPIWLLIEYAVLWLSPDPEAERFLPQRFSNGDDNEVILVFRNKSSFRLKAEVLDEVPPQFQWRDFHLTFQIHPGKEETRKYLLKPLERGVYTFGKLRVFYSWGAGFLQRRLSYGTTTEIAVYPSFLQLRRYELLAAHQRLHEIGVKKIRRPGQNKEFEKISEYQMGDDFRQINWKATARRDKLMINLFQDERSQAVYSLIDTGRVMQSPFAGMTLLDYAINASLMISFVAVQKYDKAGLIYFDHKQVHIVPAEKRQGQMHRIQEELYRLDTDFMESDYERMAIQLRRAIPQRSLLILYTQFDSVSSMQRRLPYLRSLARNHVLLVVLFRNTEIQRVSQSSSSSLQGVYLKTLAEKFELERELITEELRREGIYSLLTEPANLNIGLINRYLELKSGGVI